MFDNRRHCLSPNNKGVDNERESRKNDSDDDKHNDGDNDNNYMCIL